MFQRLSVSLLLVVAFLLLGCRTAEVVQPLPTATVTLLRPTATAFPSPTTTPIIEREWNAEPVVLWLHHQSAGKKIPHVFAPAMVVYANGRVVLESNLRSSGEDVALQEGYLSTDELCELIETIEGYGTLC